MKINEQGQAIENINVKTDYESDYYFMYKSMMHLEARMPYAGAQIMVKEVDQEAFDKIVRDNILDIGTNSLGKYLRKTISNNKHIVMYLAMAETTKP